MKTLTYNEKIAVMRILTDIMLADGKIDAREEAYLSEVALELELQPDYESEVGRTLSFLALSSLSGISAEQKLQLTLLMGKMIVADKDINYNEVKIYDIVCDFLGIAKEFAEEDLFA